VRVRQEPHVRSEIGIQRQTVLESRNDIIAIRSTAAPASPNTSMILLDSSCTLSREVSMIVSAVPRR